MQRNANRIFDKKHIKLFEAFSGIGTQKMALEILAKELGLEIETVGYSEIDKFAIKSYKAIHGDHIKNYGNVEHIDELPYSDICTWSFPCQDISLAGKQRGMVEGSRSNYGYVFLDLLERTKNKPKVLLMENVKALVSKKFKKDFTTILERLQEMGYKNYYEVLNAKHYGVPQNRERVFVVSILDDGYYEFPKKLPLLKRLKDYLETEVDEKFYLTAKQLYSAFTTGYAQSSIDRIPLESGIAPTIKALSGGNLEPKVILEPRIGYALSSMEFSIGGWKEISPTLLARDYKDPKVILEDTGVSIDNKFLINDRILKDGKETGNFIVSDLLGRAYVYNKGRGLYRIRKLTPLESWRLMGVDDEDFYKAQAVNSNSQLYKQAGNAIVVDVLYHIFKQMFI